MKDVFNYIEAFKNREIDLNKPVYVYRCLNKKGFYYSIKQGGLVRGHSEFLTLCDCYFIVNQSGREKYINTGIKNVHAFIKGYLQEYVDFNEEGYKIYYNPDSPNGFETDSLGFKETVYEMDEVKIIRNKVIGIYLKSEPLFPNEW